MKFRFNPQKNFELIEKRGIGFEEIIHEINQGNLLDIIAHHNSTKYPTQKIMLILVLGKVYCAPYVREADNVLFLKTIYPSRKATKKYFASS